MTLEEKLGYFFFDKRILTRALTRKTYALEQQQKNQECDDQEAYQILGEAVLKTVLTELLIRAGANTAQEITDKKVALEGEENLAKISEEIGIGYVLKLGIDEKQQRAYEQPSVLTETLEAVIGGIYFDGGYSAARQAIQRLFQTAFAIE